MADQDPNKELAAIADAKAHIEEAFQVLTGKCWRGSSAASLEKVELFCVTAEDLKRIDKALGLSGGTILAKIASDIEIAYTEIVAARKALER